ncbi:MAG: transglutaminase family protein [Chlamydiota bacterium]
MTRYFIIPLMILAASALAREEPSSAKLDVLYNSLDPHSVAKHLAYYRLYYDTPQGEKSLQHAWKLLSGSQPPDHFEHVGLSLEGLANQLSNPYNSPQLEEGSLKAIENLASSLSNRKLPGSSLQTLQNIKELPPNDVDLSRALLLSYDLPPEKIRHFEALLDFIALQIKAMLPNNPTEPQKIAAINRFIFADMHFRFPPESLYQKKIDNYTFLPDVLDSRRGVCLGVSIIYYCIAQRLNLPLVAITPPGHIFLRFDGPPAINIETTAHGIDLPDEKYLSLNTHKLQRRSTLEIVGLAHFNQAAIFFQQKQYTEALESYHKALEFLPGDPQVLEFTAYCQILQGNKKLGKQLLKKIVASSHPYAITSNALIKDLLNGDAPREGLEIIFHHTPDDRQGLLDHQKALEKILSYNPRFRSGHLALAQTWLELSRHKEAIVALEAYHNLDNSNPFIEYLLAALYVQRYNYRVSWEHLLQAEKLCSAHDYYPTALKQLHRQLEIVSPRTRDTP